MPDRHPLDSPAPLNVVERSIAAATLTLDDRACQSVLNELNRACRPEHRLSLDAFRARLRLLLYQPSAGFDAFGPGATTH